MGKWKFWRHFENIFSQLFVVRFRLYPKLTTVDLELQKFRLLTELNPQIMWMANDDRHTGYFNPRWFEYTGMDDVSFSRDVWQKVVHPDDLGFIYEELKNSKLEGRDFTAKYRLRRKDGMYRWHFGRSHTISQSGNAGSIRIGSATDIHEEIETQSKLSELKQRTDSVIQDAPVLLWAVDAAGHFTYYDGKVAKLLGYDSQDRIGKNIFELYPGRSEISGKVKLALAGEIVISESMVNGICLENKFTPQRDANGNVTGVIGLSIDITERKKQELEKRRTSEIFLRASWAMAITDANGYFLQVNPAFGKMHGSEPRDWIGRHVREMYVDLTEEEFKAHSRTINETGRLSFESMHKSSERESFPVRYLKN